jgi:metal-dependent amidase/aminoacylase/carboxypeptidase family protein
MFLLFAALGCAHTRPEPQIDLIADQNASGLIELRRDLHRHPELSGEEERTAAVVAERLRGLGLDVRAGVGGHGVVAVLTGGRPGPTVAYRADMDASPGDEPAREVRSLVPGVHHVCGHDVHTAIGVGVASVLSRFRDDLAGRVVFLFQPAEETLAGAEAMIATGALDIAPPEAIFALHTFPLQVGTIGYAPGEGFAGMDEWSIDIPHASDEHERRILEAIDSMGTALFPASPELMKQYLRDLADPRSNLSEGVFVVRRAVRTGSELQITVTVKAARDDAYAVLRKRIAGDLEAIVGPDLYTIQFRPEVFPRAESNRLETLAAVESLKEALGAQNVVRFHHSIPFAGEDFALFLRRVPGAMFFLGVANEEKGIAGIPHLPDFDVDERAILVGTKAMSRLLLDRLARPAGSM